MSENEILSVCKQQFTLAEIFILTGSQLYRSQPDKLSDIDVVVIDEQFSVVSSRIINSGNFKFDFTMVPLADLDNVINNERFDPKGVLLSMIQEGKILFQKNGSGDLLKQKIAGVFSQVNPAASGKFNNIIQSLFSVKKIFDSKPNDRERFLAVNLFVNLVTEAEMALHNNWHLENKQKIRFLEKSNPGLIDELNDLTKQLLYGQSAVDISSLSDYIDYYQRNSLIGNAGISSSRYVIDIGSHDYDVTLIDNFINYIQDISVLKENFLYFFSCPVKMHRLFKNKFCLVFKADKGVDRKYIYFQVFSAFTRLAKTKPPISLEANYIFSKSNESAEIWLAFENTAKALSLLIIKEMKMAGAYQLERGIYFMMIFLGFIAKRLDLSIDEMLKANNYLFHRWHFTREEQYKYNTPETLNTLSAQKIRSYSEFFLSNRINIDACLKKGIKFDLNVEKDKIYFQVITELEKFIQSQTSPGDLHVNSNFFANYFLREKYNVEDLNKILNYTLLFDKLTYFLHFDTVYAGLSIYISTEVIKSLQSEKRRSEAK